jgi:hypothetical protein
MQYFHGPFSNLYSSVLKSGKYSRFNLTFFGILILHNFIEDKVPSLNRTDPFPHTLKASHAPIVSSSILLYV